MKFRRVEPDGLAAAILLSLLATAGIFYVNVMAAIVSGLVEGLHFSAAQAGRVAACNVYGAAVGAFCAVLIVRRVVWRPAGIFLLCVLIGLDLLSTLIHTAGLLALLRLLHGVTGGLLVGISYSVFARTRSPDRCFGALMVVQSSLGGLGLMFLPRLVPIFGAAVLFIALAVFSTVALLLLPFLPDYPAPAITSAMTRAAGAVAAPSAGPADAPSAAAGPKPTRLSAMLLIALSAVFLFQAGNMALSAYIIELGRVYGLGLDFMSTTIGVSGWIATVGSLCVVALGTRWGRAAPIALGTLVSVAGNAAFYLSAHALVYVAANVATAITWFFVLPYLLGLCAAFDRTGRSAALAGLFSKLGLASGPLLASVLITADPSYGSAIDLSVAALLGSALCGVWAARKVDRLA